MRPQPKRLDVWLGGIAPSELRRVGRMADGWLPSFVTPADAAAGRAVIEQVAAEHERAIEDDHYGVLIPYTLDAVARRPARPAGPPAPRPRGPADAGARRLGRRDRHDQALRRRRHDEVRRAPDHRARRRHRGTPTSPTPPTPCSPWRREPPGPLGVPLRCVTRRAQERQRPRAAIAALRPGIADTPPPRRAPAPHTNTLACAVSTPQRPRRRRRLGERPLQVAVEDVAAGHAEAGLDLERAHHLDAVRVEQAVLDRLGEHAVERAQDRRRAPRPARRRGRRGTAGPACAARTASASARRRPAGRAPRIDGSVSEWQ